MPKAKTDCFAYTTTIKKCLALKQRYCDSGECKFYKTKDEHKKERENK